MTAPVPYRTFPLTQREWHEQAAAITITPPARPGEEQTVDDYLNATD